MLKAGEQNEPKLRRNVSLFQAVMYGVGLILGAGIYVLIGDVAGIAGNAMWISFAIAAIIAVFTGLSYAELSSLFPKSAAEYVFVKNAFKSNFVAFIAGWLIVFVAVASAATVAIGFSGYMAAFFPHIEPSQSAVGLVVVLSVINFIGIKESMRLNTIFTIIELAGLAIIIATALLLGSFAGINYHEVPPVASSSFLHSAGAILTAAGLAFFAYFGFENLANISEETRNAPRTIPKALMISISVTTGVYILIAISAVALTSWKELSSSEAPLALAAEKAYGRVGVIALSAIALFATSNTVLMMLVAGSRIMFGMAKGLALPRALASVHSTTKTPWIAVLTMMVLASAAVVVSKGNIAMVANIAVFSIFIVYALVNLALIWLRHKQPKLERPFRSPIRVGWFPVLAGLGFVTSLAMLTQFDSITMIAGAVAVTTGMVSFLVTEGYKSRQHLRNDPA